MKSSIDHEHLEEGVSRFIDITTQIQVVPRPSGVDHRETDEVDILRAFPVVGDNTVGSNEAEA